MITPQSISKETMYMENVSGILILFVSVTGTLGAPKRILTAVG